MVDWEGGKTLKIVGRKRTLKGAVLLAFWWKWKCGEGQENWWLDIE